MLMSKALKLAAVHTRHRAEATGNPEQSTAIRRAATAINQLAHIVANTERFLQDDTTDTTKIIHTAERLANRKLAQGRQWPSADESSFNRAVGAEPWRTTEPPDPNTPDAPASTVWIVSDAEDYHSAFFAAFDSEIEANNFANLTDRRLLPTEPVFQTAQQCIDWFGIELEDVNE